MEKAQLLKQLGFSDNLLKTLEDYEKSGTSQIQTFDVHFENPILSTSYEATGLVVNTEPPFNPVIGVSKKRKKKKKSTHMA